MYTGIVFGLTGLNSPRNVFMVLQISIVDFLAISTYAVFEIYISIFYG